MRKNEINENIGRPKVNTRINNFHIHEATQGTRYDNNIMSTNKFINNYKINRTTSTYLTSSVRFTLTFQNNFDHCLYAVSLAISHT